MYSAVEQAVGYMWDRYGEPLSQTQIARNVQLSRFYFARHFRATTGVTPGRFLAAIRVHQAKRLLVDTSLSINDVSCAVGYNSLGSFSNYFTASVGISAGQFRRLSRMGAVDVPVLVPAQSTRLGLVAGTISLPAGHGAARIFVGAFPTAIIQGPPVAAVVVDVPTGRPCCYALSGIPEGSWSVHAVGVADGLGVDPSATRSQIVGRRDAVAVAANGAASLAMRMRRRTLIDTPVLLALPDLIPAAGTAGSGCPAVARRPEWQAAERRP